MARLREDAAKAKSARLEAGDARAKRGNGLFAAIRAALPLIDELLANDGCEWPDVVAALTKQGVRTRTGEPLTVPRLTSLIASVRKQEAASQARAARRSARSDVTALPKVDEPLRPNERQAGPAQRAPGAGARGKLALSKELAPAPPDADGASQAAAEERDRKAAHAKMGRFVKEQK